MTGYQAARKLLVWLNPFLANDKAGSGDFIIDNILPPSQMCFRKDLAAS